METTKINFEENFDALMTQYVGEIEYRKKLEELHRQKRRMKMVRNTVLSLAAAISLLLGCAVLFKYMNRPPANERLYAAYYTPLKADNFMGENHQAEDLFAKAMQLYNQQDFAGVIRLAGSTTGIEPRVAIYLAISYMQCNQHTMAIPIFERIIKRNDINLDRATWYLALCYLKNKNSVAKAKDTLKQIVKAHNNYSNDAQKILDELRE